MSGIVRSALLALTLGGAAVCGTGSANAAGTVGFYLGTNGVHLEYNTGYYYDRFHHRQMYRYPVEWRRYRYPLSWYQTHADWYRNRDWMRYHDGHRDDRDGYRR